MAASPPQDSPSAPRREVAETRNPGVRTVTGADDLWPKISTTFVAILFGILAFFGREMYSDVKTHTIQLATLTERVTDIKEKVDKIAGDTEQNARSLAEIKGFLQAMPSSSSSANDGNRSHRH
jgi:hypothetical protein